MGRKGPLLTLQRQQVAVGQQFDSRMASSLYQARGQDAGGAVVGREGLVQPDHVPPDGGGPFHQIDLNTCIREVQCGLDTGYATTQY
jgi:hypothetical protein